MATAGNGGAGIDAYLSAAASNSSRLRIKGKNAEANYLVVSDSPERVKSLVDEQMARYITEQENSIRSLQTDTVKKINELKQKRALLLQEYKETKHGNKRDRCPDR